MVSAFFLREPGEGDKVTEINIESMDCVMKGRKTKQDRKPRMANLI